jgi:hypothetical protein
MKITYDNKSFMIDGRRTLILSGEVHYFRLPKAEWKTALSLAKACGLNAISTYIPWNFHEPQEGKWDFSGDRDLEAFLRLCKQLKLLVIARPGPYICAEWTFGGFPAWMHAKGIKHLRTSDAAYMAAADHYLDKVLGILAKHQVSQGGPVFLVQVENEFDHAPQDPAYLRHLDLKFKKKISVPLFYSLGDTKNGGGHSAGSLVAVNGFEGLAGHLEKARKSLGHTRCPLMVSEFWTGWFSGWGRPAKAKSAEQMETALTEALGAGASLINQYMFAGGTNFGEWAGRQVGGDRFFCTTSYDYGAPVGEALEAGPKARRLNLWARWASCHEETLLGTDTEINNDQPVVPSETRVTLRSKGDVRYLFLHNPTSQEIRGKVQFEDTVPYTLGPGERKAFAFNIPLTPSLSLRACTHPWIHQKLGNRTVVLLWGEPGDKVTAFGTGTLDVESRTNDDVALEHERRGFVLSATISSRPQHLLGKVLFEAGKPEVLFLLVTRRLAETLQRHPERPLLVLGAEEMDTEAGKARIGAGAQTLVVVTGTKLEETFLTGNDRDAKRVPVAVTGAFDEKPLLAHAAGRKDWVASRAGIDLAEHGFLGDRAWVKVRFDAAAKGKRALFFPGLEDQAAVFSKGQALGLYGRLGKGPRLDLAVDAGSNELLLLVEGLGRYCFGTKLGEKKGLALPVFDGGEVLPFSEGWHFLEAEGALDFKIFSSPTFMGRGWEVGSLPGTLERTGYVCARKKFTVPAWAKRVRMNLHAGDIQIFVALNGGLIDQHPDLSGSGYKEIELTPALIQGENTLALFFKGPTSGFEKAELLYLGAELKADFTACEGAYGPDELEVLEDKDWSKSRKGKVGFWRGQFKSLPVKELSSAWLKLKENGRGTAWVNGQSLGRFNVIGPQDLLKIPLSWLKPSNEILVLEEEAAIPGGAEVVFRFKKQEIKLPL